MELLTGIALFITLRNFLFIVVFIWQKAPRNILNMDINQITVCLKCYLVRRSHLRFGLVDTRK